MPDNIWSYWLEDTPEALYGAMTPTTSPMQQKYWGSQYGNVWQDYMSKLGKMALGGSPPNLNFSSFLQSYPFQEYWSQMSPSQRGVNTSLYPSYRWNV